ncbi:hypothetical protein AVEN_58155-1 [Araneus ventricosus]|uniref:Uncharacterized protein n=1 Tax=Araneus ventricosus TaxID=182803 RepID=A0A4Y2T500_ARAVE|nr:hypothetical protein AVEN_58155-1 [Araneus ventricosus]
MGEGNVHLLSSLTSAGLGFKGTRFQITVGIRGLIKFESSTSTFLAPTGLPTLYTRFYPTFPYQFHMHDGPFVEACLEAATSKSRSRDSTTRPPRYIEMSLLMRSKFDKFEINYLEYLTAG